MAFHRTPRAPFFRDILSRALEHAWHHRELWPLAALAGILGMGSGLNDILTQAQFSSALPSTNPLALLSNLSFLQRLFQALLFNGHTSLWIFLLSFFGILLGGVLFLCLCQHILLRASHTALTKSAPLTLSELIRDATHPRLFSLLVLNLFVHILVLNVVLFSGILVAHLRPDALFFDAFFGVIFLLSTLILSFALHIWGMLALVCVVLEKMSLVRALERAWKVLTLHPVFCIEFACSMFAVTFCLSLLAMSGLLLIGSISPLFLSQAFSASTTSFDTVLTHFFTLVLGTLWAFALAGFSTLFTYMSWTGLFFALRNEPRARSSRTLHHLRTTLGHLLS